MNSLTIDAQITFLYVRSLAESARFYEEIMGFPLAVDQGSCRIFRVTGASAYLGICERGADSRGKNALIFTLVTPDVDGWHERVTAKGWPCEHEPRVNETYGIYHFFLRDPDGYRIEVQRFLAESWDKGRA